MHESPEDQVAIVLGQRQLIAVCCMFLTVLGLVATLAYVTGRSISAAQFQAKEGEKVEGPHPMVVDPPRALEARADTLQLQPTGKPVGATASPAVIVAPVVPAAPPVVAPKPAATMAPVVAPAVVATTTPPANLSQASEPARGQTFWQVGMVDPGMASALAEYLTKLGVPARTASGSSPQWRRVLVGPLTAQAEVSRTKQVLDTARFQSFLKTY